MRIYKRPKSAHWWYDFTFECNRVRKSSGKLTKREAAIVADDHLHRLRNGAASIETGWQLTHALGSYWSEVGNTKASAPSIWRYFERLSDIIGPAKLISEISNADIMEYRAHRRGQDGVKPHTVNRDIDMLRAALFHARDIHGQQVPNLAWKKVKVPEAPHRVRFLSAEEYLTLLDCAHHNLRPIILCAVATGLRRENILELKWSQIDLASAIITVPVTKNGDPLQLRITGEFLQLLSTMNAHRSANAIALGRIPNREDAIFDRTGFRRRWASAVKKANLKNIRFHDLRHTFASWARIAGADLATIMEAMGHSNISVTMRYAHINPATHRTAFDAAADMIRAAHSPAHQTIKDLK
jgi:integrase